MKDLTQVRLSTLFVLLAVSAALLAPGCGNPKLRAKLQQAQEHRLAGETALKIKDYAKAETEFKAALSLAPAPVADLYNSLGVAQNGLKKYSEAAKNLEKAVSMEKNNFRYHMNLGTVYFFQKKKAEALNQWEIALDLAPGNKELKAAYERIKYHDN